MQRRNAARLKRRTDTAEDWHNRKKWDANEQAVCEMVDRSSSDIASWALLEANDKYFARVRVLKTLCERIGQALYPLRNSTPRVSLHLPPQRAAIHSRRRVVRAPGPAAMGKRPWGCPQC